MEDDLYACTERWSPSLSEGIKGLPSLTPFACDTREYVFSHAYTQMNENHTRIGKLAEI